MYDIEIFADRFEQEEAYRLECEAEQVLENAAAEQVLTDLEQAARDLLERMDAQLERIQSMHNSTNTSEQTEEETAMFEEWLS